MKKIYIEPKAKVIEVKLHKMFAASPQEETNGFGGNATSGDEGDAKEEFNDFGW